jgi:hypothetical protein
LAGRQSRDLAKKGVEDMKIRYFIIIAVFLPFLILLQLAHAQEKGSGPLTEKEIEKPFKSHLLTSIQIKTLLDNASTMFRQGNKLEYVQEDLERFLVESPNPSSGDVSKQMSILFAGHEIGSIADLLHSNALLQLQFAVSRDGTKRIYLPLTKKTVASLRDNIDRTLTVLKFVYSINDKAALFQLYDRTREILRSALTTIDENIRIIGYL